MNSADIAAFHAFGYVVLRRCIAPARMTQLTDAFERGIDGALRFEHFGAKGTRSRGHAEDTHPAFAELIANEALRPFNALFAQPAIYLSSFLLDNRDATPWHTTGLPGEGPETIRASIYLDSASIGDGAFCVLPGSHHHEYSRRLFDACGWMEGDAARLRLPVAEAPGAFAIETEPGDLVLWHTRLWHSAWPRQDARSRRGIFLTYTPDPGSNMVACEKLRRTCRRELVSFQRPYLYGDALRALNSDAISAMAARLAGLGVTNVWPEADERRR